MTRTRLIPLLLALVMAVAACEPSTFTTPTTSTTPPVAGDAGDGGGQTPPTTDPVSGCDGTPFPGDPAFAALVCDYQAILLGALADGIDVGADLRSQATDALVQWVTDPAGARTVLENAIAEIENARSLLPTTTTVVDVADDLFSCIDTATDLLAEATNRVEIGGVVIPGLDDWRATFDQAAALAESGDVVGATQLLCDLNVEMDAWLFQS